MCAGYCKALDDLSNKLCVLIETEGLNVHVFNMITVINVNMTLMVKKT